MAGSAAFDDRKWLRWHARNFEEPSRPCSTCFDSTVTFLSVFLQSISNGISQFESPVGAGQRSAAAAGHVHCGFGLHEVHPAQRLQLPGSQLHACVMTPLPTCSSSSSSTLVAAEIKNIQDNEGISYNNVNFQLPVFLSVESF